MKHCVAQDLVHVNSALVGVVHSAFSLNCKVRELTAVGLKNHHSTTTSHVRFVLKMAKAERKSEGNSSKSKGGTNSSELVKLEKSVTSLKEENSELKTHVKRLESRLDSFIVKMNSHIKASSSKGSNKTKMLEVGEGKDSQ